MDPLVKKIEEAQLRKDIPSFSPGDTVSVGVIIVEGNKKRIQNFEGTVIRRSGSSLRETFIIRKVVAGIGVERTFLLHSPIIDKITIKRKSKVRRAKLYYLRDRIGTKATRLEEDDTAKLALAKQALKKAEAKKSDLKKNQTKSSAGKEAAVKVS